MFVFFVQWMWMVTKFCQTPKIRQKNNKIIIVVHTTNSIYLFILTHMIALCKEKPKIEAIIHIILCIKAALTSC